MIKPAPSALAVLLVLSPALVGCASADPAASTSSVAASSPATTPAGGDTAGGDAGAGSGQAASGDAADPADDAAPTQGSWIDQATYEADPATYHAAGDVVLFFSATWCPSCKRTVDNLDADGVPAGLTVVRVDYDTNAELKRAYGVTYQHTFVHVDAAGTQLGKFTGALTGEAIAGQLA